MNTTLGLHLHVSKKLSYALDIYIYIISRVCIINLLPHDTLLLLLHLPLYVLL